MHNSIIKDGKLSRRETQTNKCTIKICNKNKTGTIFKISKNNVEDEELTHESFLTTRQITKIRNSFTNNISTDIKLSKSQIS